MASMSSGIVISYVRSSRPPLTGALLPSTLLACSSNGCERRGLRLMSLSMTMSSSWKVSRVGNSSRSSRIACSALEVTSGHFHPPQRHASAYRHRQVEHRLKRYHRLLPSKGHYPPAGRWPGSNPRQPRLRTEMFEVLVTVLTITSVRSAQNRVVLSSSVSRG